METTMTATKTRQGWMMLSMMQDDGLHAGKLELLSGGGSQKVGWKRTGSHGRGRREESRTLLMKPKLY